MKMMRKSSSWSGLRTEEEDIGCGAGGAATPTKGFWKRGNLSGISSQNQACSEMELRRQQFLASKGHRSASDLQSAELQEHAGLPTQDNARPTITRVSSNRSLRSVRSVSSRNSLRSGGSRNSLRSMGSRNSLRSMGSKRSFQQDFIDEGDGTMQLFGLMMDKKERGAARIPSKPPATVETTSTYLPRSIDDSDTEGDDVSVLSADDDDIEQQQIEPTKSQNGLMQSMPGTDLNLDQDKEQDAPSGCYSMQQELLQDDAVEYKRFRKPSAAQTTRPTEKESTAQKKLAGRRKGPLSGSMSDLLALLESEVKQIKQSPGSHCSREQPNKPTDRLQARVNELTLRAQQKSAGEPSQIPAGRKTLPYIRHEDMEDSESDDSDDSSYSDVSTTDHGSSYFGDLSHNPVGDISQHQSNEASDARLHPVRGNIPSDQASCVSDSTWTQFTIKTNQTPSGGLEMPSSSKYPPTGGPSPTRVMALNDITENQAASNMAADPPARIPSPVLEEPEVPLVTNRVLPKVISFNSLPVDAIEDDVSVMSTHGKKVIRRKTSTVTVSTDPETTAEDYDHEVESLSDHSDSSSEFSVGDQLLRELLEESDKKSSLSCSNGDKNDSDDCSSQNVRYDAARRKGKQHSKIAGDRRPNHYYSGRLHQ